MRAALRGKYIEYVIFMGSSEKYPPWFEKQLELCTYTDESRLTFWVNKDERRPNYYDQQLIEEYSIILRKDTGELHITDYDSFDVLYTIFRYDAFTNSGLAAFEEDCIEYVECTGGMLSAAYPDWFYEYFTECINLPDDETVFLNDDVQKVSINDGPFLAIDEYGGVSVDSHCVFLRNKFGEIKGMEFNDFIKHYDYDPDQEPIIWG